MAKRVEVLIADDSRVSRLALRRIVESDPDMVVVADAVNGKEAVEKAQAERPDIVLMDFVMPVMDGLAATRELMRTQPTPIALVSDLVGRDASLNFKALEAGALDLLGKPSSQEVAEMAARSRFARKVRLISEVPVVRRGKIGSARKEEKTAPLRETGLRPVPAATRSLVCIGASTGGPPAIRKILGEVDREIPAPIVIVQHMTQGFIGGMVDWLRKECSDMRVELVHDAVVPKAGTIYLAPDDVHLKLQGARLSLDAEPRDTRHCPSIDVFFASVAQSTFAARTTAVLLTGMGDDGARGLLGIREAGGWTISQDEESSVVYGMPRAAAEMGASREVLPLDRIATRLGETMSQQV